MQNIYRQMIEDSPMAYIHIKIIRDYKNGCKQIEIKDANKSFERTFNMDIKESINKIYSVKNILSKEGILDWEYIINKANQNKKYVTKKYIQKVKLYFNIEIYTTENDEFHMRLTKMSKDDMKLSSILKNSPCLAWIKDVDGVYVDVNYTYANLYNTTPEELIGKTDYDIWDKAHADKLKEEDEYISKGNTLYNYDELVYINNKKVYLETSKWPYTDESNKFILGSIGIAMITNDKVELRNNIEKNEKIFKEIANNIEEIIMIRDEKKALYVSPSFEKIYGVTPEELNLYDDMNNWYAYWDSVEFEEEPVDYKCRQNVKDIFKVTKKGQEDIWMWSRFVPIFDENGNIIKKVGILSNITESKKIQEEIDDMKMEFFANLSHELRTPINLILSALQVIYLRLYNLEEEDVEFYDKYLSIINQNGVRLLKLVNNLIDTTKIDSGQFDYVPQNSDIVSCIENICMSVSDFVQSNNLNIIFDTDEEEKIVSFDPDNMERIMLNLLSNAIKFNKPGGEIKVNIECDEDIKIIVKDTGIGVPKDKLETIFERFEQVKSKFKKEREGSGIGLSLVKSLVEIHGGQISVQSRLNEGTVFTISLPNILLDDEIKIINPQAKECLRNTSKMAVEFSDI